MDHSIFRELLEENGSFSKPFCIPVGLKNGSPVYWDLNEIPNILISGASGSGKTNFAKTLLLSLCSRVSSAELNILIYSSKPFEYQAFGRLPQVEKLLSADHEAFETAVTLLAEEAERRRELRTKSDKHIIFLIDDMDDAPSDSLSEVVREHLTQLLKIGRIVNIHTILLMNTPTKEYLPEEMETCLSCRVSFSVHSPSTSRLIIGKEGAETLRYPGELMCRYWNDFDRFMTTELTVPDENACIAAIAEGKSGLLKG